MGCGAILVLILCCLAVALVDANVEVDALHEWRQIVYDPNDVMLSWDPTLVNPCTWFHITCNTNNSVTRVDVGNAGLSGSLTPALANLTNLQYFQAFGNNLTGAIPKELGRLTNLVSLNLSNNQLSGSIPRSLGNLKSLSLLGLNSNALTGDIPTKLLQLVPLGRLRLFNVSHNFLAGSLSSGKSKGGDVMTIIVQDPRA